MLLSYLLCLELGRLAAEPKPPCVTARGTPALCLELGRLATRPTWDLRDRTPAAPPVLL